MPSISDESSDMGNENKQDEKRFKKEKGDEILRRLLKTPPDPKTGKGEQRKKAADKRDQKDQAAKRR